MVDALRCIVRRAADVDNFDRVLLIERFSFATCWLQNFIEEDLRKPISRLWLACDAQDRGQVVGYVAALRVLDELHLLQIAVNPVNRRKGIAQSMLEHAIAEEADLKTVQLEVRHRNVAAISFYKKMDFEFVGIRRGYYSDTGDDAILFTKEFW